MKLLYITTKVSGAGGMQRVIAAKTDFLIESKGYEIDILLSNTEPEEEVFYEFNKRIKFHTIIPDKTPLNYLKSYSRLLNREVNDINPDAIIMCDNGYKSFMLPFILKGKYPMVYEMHVSKFLINRPQKGLFRYFKNKVNFALMSFCARRFNKFVVLTEQGAAEWPLKNVVVISNPLWFSSGGLNSLDTKTVLAVGRHTYEKGFDRMLKIWKKVIVNHPDWQLIICGERNKGCDIVKIAEHEGLTESVKFMEPTKSIVEVYKNASIYIMTSRWEGFGMVLLEAMECGIPCIAYNCPVGPSGIIKDGYNGFLIEDGKKEDFINAFENIITDNSLRNQMGKNAKATASGFGINEIMEQWHNLFLSLKR